MQFCNSKNSGKKINCVYCQQNFVSVKGPVNSDYRQQNFIIFKVMVTAKVDKVVKAIKTAAQFFNSKITCMYCSICRYFCKSLIVSATPKLIETFKRGWRFEYRVILVTFKF